MTGIDPQAPVLVTGASGYMGSWIVRRLLEEGHTVRDPDKESGLEHLHKLASDHPDRLTLVKADLLDDGVFDAPMQGCELVVHNASPFIIAGIKDPDRQLVQPALTGTRNVLRAVDDTPSVKRVVLTSSVAAIYGDAEEAERVPGGVFTEEQWNTTSSHDHQPYSYSKTVAEREAWRIQQDQDRWDLVTVHPGLVLGPSLTTASASTSRALTTSAPSSSNVSSRSQIASTSSRTISAPPAPSARARSATAESALTSVAPASRSTSARRTPRSASVAAGAVSTRASPSVTAHDRSNERRAPRLCRR